MKKMWLNLQRTVDKRGRIGKKGPGDYLRGAGVTSDDRVKSNSDSYSDEQNGRQFSRKNRGDTIRPSCLPGCDSESPTLVTPL